MTKNISNTSVSLERGNIPVLSVSGENLPDAWENAVLAVWEQGVEIKTEYDKTEDPPSKDATVMIEVKDPFGEPRIHKNFPGGLQDLEIYRQEMVTGIHDHWIDPDAGKWSYTYHKRLTDYDGLDQIEYIVNKLVDTHYSRRVQAITWIPKSDPFTDDPPCLQRVWCRILQGENGDLTLNMNTHWRSRDLYKAWFMNAYAITDLQRIIAEMISDKTGCDIKIGRYVDISDSLHIYGSYFDEVTKEIEKMKGSSYRERAWSSQDPVIAQMIDEAKTRLRDNPDFMMSR